MDTDVDSDDAFNWDLAKPASPERRAEVGWRAFTRRLENHLLRLVPDATTRFEVRATDELLSMRSPYVQFAQFGPGWIRAEVSSNDFIAPEFWMDEGHEFLMRRMGWQLEPDGNWYLHEWQDRSAEVSVLVVRVLREVFAVPSKHELMASPGVELALGITPSRSFLDK